MLLNEEADMVLTSLKINPDRSKAVRFSVPFLETGITIVVSLRDGAISPTAFLGNIIFDVITILIGFI